MRIAKDQTIAIKIIFICQTSLFFRFLISIIIIKKRRESKTNKSIISNSDKILNGECNRDI